MLLALLALVAYARTVGFEFVYDDRLVIEQREIVHSLANWRALLHEPWLSGELYRPLTLLSFAADWTLSDGAPAWFHAVNALVHAAVTLLVFLLARSMLGLFGAATAGVLFAMHPVHVDAVASIVGRAELLAALFTVAAALAYRAHGDFAARGGASGPRRWMAAGCLAAVLGGLASKETAFAAPAVLLAVDWLAARQAHVPLAQRFALNRWLWASSVVAAVGWLGIRTAVLGSLAGGSRAPEFVGLDFGDRALAMAPVVLEHARLLFFPLRLSVDYSADFLPVTPALTAEGVAGAGLVVAAVAVAVAARHPAPSVTFAFAWIALTLVIVSNVVIPTGVALAERTLYRHQWAPCCSSGGSPIAPSLEDAWSRRPSSPSWPASPS